MVRLDDLVKSLLFARCRPGRVTLVLVRDFGTGGADAQSARGLSDEARTVASRLGRLLRARRLRPVVVVSEALAPSLVTAATVAAAAGYEGPVLVAEAGGVDALFRPLSETPANGGLALLVGGEAAIAACLEASGDTRGRLPPGGAAIVALPRWPEQLVDLAAAREVELLRPRARASRAGARSGGSKWLSLQGTETAGEAAIETLEDRFERTLRCVSALTEDSSWEDREPVRRLRVAVRRSQAALRVYRDLLPRRAADDVRRLLRRLRRSAGAVRDLDVAIGCLEARVTAASAAVFLASMREQRSLARRELAQVVATMQRDGGLVRAMSALQLKTRRRAAAAPALRSPLRDWAATAIDQERQRFLRLAAGPVGDTWDAASLHGLRLATKKLRYAIEILADVLAPSVRISAYPLLEALQDRLGAACDHDAALLVLERVGARKSDSAGEAAGGAGLVDVECELFESARREVAEWWTPDRRESLRAALAGA